MSPLFLLVPGAAAVACLVWALVLKASLASVTGDRDLKVSQFATSQQDLKAAEQKVASAEQAHKDALAGRDDAIASLEAKLDAMRAAVVEKKDPDEVAKLLGQLWPVKKVGG